MTYTQLAKMLEAFNEPGRWHLRYAPDDTTRFWADVLTGFPDGSSGVQLRLVLGDERRVSQADVAHVVGLLCVLDTAEALVMQQRLESYARGGVSPRPDNDT